MTLSRRQFVTGAAVAVPAIWVTPQILSVPIASATDLGSRPPSTPPKQTVSQPQMGPPIPDGIPASLPFTGNNEQVALELGAAAVAAGVVLTGLAHVPKREPLS